MSAGERPYGKTERRGRFLTFHLERRGRFSTFHFWARLPFFIEELIVSEAGLCQAGSQSRTETYKEFDTGSHIAL